MEYEIATRELIPNLGEKKFQAVSQEGVTRSITAQVCAVNKALMSVKKVMRAGNRVVFDEEETYIEDKVTGDLGHRRWRDVHGEDVGQQEGGFLEAGERAGESTGSIRPMGMEVDKLEEEDAFKFDDEDPRPEDRSAGEDEGEQAGREDEGEEGRRAKGMTAPMKMSDKEREEHELTHTPFRAWCPYCVRARGRNTGHLKNQGINKDKSNEVPRMSMDYFFMSQEDEKASANPIMVMVDERTGEKYARAVGTKAKGPGHGVAHQGHVERVEGVGAPWWDRGKHHPEVGRRTSKTCGTRCSGEVPWRHSRTRRASCR